MRRLILIAAVVLPLAGCFYPASRGKALEQRLDRMDSEKAELAAAVEQQRQRLESEVAAKVAEVEKALEKLEKSARRTGADMGVQLEQMQQDVSALRGQVDQYLYRISQCEAQLQALKDSAKQAPSEAKPLERPADKKAFAELVTAKLHDDPGLGRTLAGEWLRKWPRDPLAAQVHLQLGSSYAADKDYRAAIAEYGEIFKDFPKSEIVPDALFKSAECFLALKKRDEAKLALEEIVNSHPKSSVAKPARAKLAELKKQKK